MGLVAGTSPIVCADHYSPKKRELPTSGSSTVHEVESKEGFEEMSVTGFTSNL